MGPRYWEEYERRLSLVLEGIWERFLGVLRTGFWYSGGNGKENRKGIERRSGLAAKE